MGHERLGILPKSPKWRAIVARIGATAIAEANVADVANATLRAVRHRFEHLHEDQGVQAAFEFLVGLANIRPGATAWADIAVDLADDPSALQLAQALRNWVGPRVQSREYSELATRAATDTIVTWHANQTRQAQIFGGPTAMAVWSAAGSGVGFCEVARLFFARFTERYLNYFLDREASDVLPTIASRERQREGVSLVRWY
jgi:hypothetical protein